MSDSMMGGEQTAADPCHLYSDALDESLRKLDVLLAMIRRQTEDLWRCKNGMELSTAESGGDNYAATVLKTTLTEIEAYKSQLKSQIEELKRT